MQLAHSKTLIDALPESWVERMFDSMLLNFGKKFTDQWAGADVDKLIAHWSIEMRDYKGPEIKRGLDAMADLDWPPTLPQFKRLCRPPVDTVHAYYEAISGLQSRAKGEVGTWSHPAVFHAATSLSFDLLNQTFSTIKQRWEKSLADQMEKGAWEPIPPAFVALAAPGKEWDKKAAGQQLKALGATGVLSNSGRDPKAWIKKIQDRVAAGDKTVTVYQLREVKIALANTGVA